jgi:hypothetical protein
LPALQARLELPGQEPALCELHVLPDERHDQKSNGEPVKQRITVTIDTPTVRSVDALIDGTMIRNRSHAVEIALKAYAQRQKSKRAAVPAAPLE